MKSVQTIDKAKLIRLCKKKPVSKNMHKIILENELNQHDENMLTEEIFVSDTCCVCLKKTSDALACKMCQQKIHNFCGHVYKVDEIDIFCNIFFKTKNTIESKINSKITLKIQDKK